MCMCSEFSSCLMCVCLCLFLVFYACTHAMHNIVDHPTISD